MVALNDSGIVGALKLYKDDRDIEGLKARIYHKVLQVTNSRADWGASSAATTA